MSLPKLRFFLVNAFALDPHGGNQAAVVLFPKDDPRVNDEKYYSLLSRDFSLPMTALVVPVSENEGHYAIRWFNSIGKESRLCGHATLATAKVLFSLHDIDTITLDTKYRGTLTAKREGESIGISLPIGGPATPSHDAELRHLAACAAGITVADIDQVSTYPDANGLSAVFRVKAKVNLAGRKVDVVDLGRKLPGYNIYTQVVEGSGDSAKINSRVFVPYAGIDEDPVTGSAHSVLSEYYLLGAGREAIAAAGVTVDGKDVTLDATQQSARGGGMKCSLEDGRVKVVGKGWITGSGELEVL